MDNSLPPEKTPAPAPPKKKPFRKGKNQRQEEATARTSTNQAANVQAINEATSRLKLSVSGEHSVYLTETNCIPISFIGIPRLVRNYLQLISTGTNALRWFDDPNNRLIILRIVLEMAEYRLELVQRRCYPPSIYRRTPLFSENELALVSAAASQLPLPFATLIKCIGAVTIHGTHTVPVTLETGDEGQALLNWCWSDLVGLVTRWTEAPLAYQLCAEAMQTITFTLGDTATHTLFERCLRQDAPAEAPAVWVSNPQGTHIRPRVGTNFFVRREAAVTATDIVQMCNRLKAGRINMTPVAFTDPEGHPLQAIRFQELTNTDQHGVSAIHLPTSDVSLAGALVLGFDPLITTVLSPLQGTILERDGVSERVSLTRCVTQPLLTILELCKSRW